MNRARNQRLPLGAFCFEKSPSHFFGKPAPLLCGNQEKMELFRRAGLEFVIFGDFGEMKDMSPEEFVADFLYNRCKCRMAVCGFNYTFGKNGSGQPEDLARQFGLKNDCVVSIVPPVTDGGLPVSSTAIRYMIENRCPDDAARLLGRPFAIVGAVKKGRQIARKMKTPTANITFPENGVVPAYGVYAVNVRLGEKTYGGIANVGVRPTFDDGDDVWCETFIFDFDEDLYGREIEVSFLKFIRDEKGFDTVDKLADQIRKDIDFAKKYFS